MNCQILLIAATTLALPSFARADQLPGTLNFANVTADRVVQTVQESASNEKEVDFGDFDNDGDLDVVVASAHSDFGQRRNKLYRNDDGVFNEVSGAPIIPEFAGTDVSRSIFMRDYDGDGWLDIYVMNDGNTPAPAGADKVLINVHQDGKFSHFVNETADRMPFQNFGCDGFGCTGSSNNGVSIDVDLDGDFDLYSASGPNSGQDRLYLNDGRGVFTDVTDTNVPPEGGYTVDVAAADMNGDGRLDLLLSYWAPNQLFYNNSYGAGSEDGDFSYPGSVQDLGNAGANENAMRPIDVDNDGDMDIYWSNRFSLGDRILLNTGNNANHQAVFVLLPAVTLPNYVNVSASSKATAADLNGDGRTDLVVGMGSGGNSRLAILRNATVDSEVLFIDWTPGDEFPNGSVHRGWHAAAFDSNNDGDIDIFLGGWNDDHLFENVPANEVDENDLGGFLPPVYNTDPVAVLGHSEEGEVDIYVADDIGDDSFISVVLNGPDDYLLEVLNVDDVLLADSDRGGLGIEEALQVTITSAGTYKVRVTVNESAGSQFDLDGNGSVGASDLLLLLAQWGTDPGGPPDFDGDGTVGASDLLALLINWGPVPSSNDYILEVLSRTGP